MWCLWGTGDMAFMGYWIHDIYVILRKLCLWDSEDMVFLGY